MTITEIGREILIRKVDGLVANDLELNRSVVHAVFPKNFYSAHESGARWLVFVKQVSSQKYKVHLPLMHQQSIKASKCISHPKLKNLKVTAVDPNLTLRGDGANLFERIERVVTANLITL